MKKRDCEKLSSWSRRGRDLTGFLEKKFIVSLALAEKLGEEREQLAAAAPLAVSGQGRPRGRAAQAQLRGGVGAQYK